MRDEPERRTPCSAGIAPAFRTFSLVGALPSTLSAASGACPLLCSTASSVLLRHLTPHCRACRTAAFAYSRRWGLPVLVHTISLRAGGLRLRGSAVRLAISAVTTCCLPLQTTGSATSVRGFRSSIPCPSLPLF